MDQKALEIEVYGRVQGVFFRKNTLTKATSLQLQGWVRNEPDGSVRLHAQGEANALEELRKWCHIGSSASRVDRVVVNETELIEVDRFYIDK